MEAFSGNHEKAIASILEEDITKRESNVKHFRLSDGSYVAVIYNESVHYEKDGEWKDIDNTLTETYLSGDLIAGEAEVLTEQQYVEVTGQFEQFKQSTDALLSDAVTKDEMESTELAKEESTITKPDIRENKSRSIQQPMMYGI